MANFFDANRNAGIRSRRTRNNKLRTETYRRDSGFDAAVVTDARTHGTNLFVDFEGGDKAGGTTVQMTGRQARTLFRLLSNHYSFTSKSFDPIRPAAPTVR